MEIEAPRSREGGFELKIVPKRQKRERRGFDGKTLPMYGLGLSTKAVQENLKDIYNAGARLNKPRYGRSKRLGRGAAARTA
jgi:transposase-like protein